MYNVYVKYFEVLRDDGIENINTLNFSGNDEHRSHFHTNEGVS